MKPREIFAVAVRIAGLIVLLYGLGHLLYGVLGSAGMFETRSVGYHGVFGVCEVVTGLFMMRGMTPLVEIAFPSEATGSEEPTPDTKQSERYDDTAA